MTTIYSTAGTSPIEIYLDARNLTDPIRVHLTMEDGSGQANSTELEECADAARAAAMRVLTTI